MRRARRSIALLLLATAVLCSPAGVCVIDGVAATVQAKAPAHAHACCKTADGPFLAASDVSCCSEPRTGFVHVFRFTLEKHAAVLALEFDLTPAAPARFVSFPDVERRAPLVLRI
jgi:hypothetical protein